MTKNLRYQMVDLIRGVAVALMIFFHFFYDLNQFGYVNINFYKDPFWFYLPRLIVTLFLFAVGISLVIAHKKTFNKEAYIKRLIKIGLGALIITATTYFMFPKNWVYFGTLHCIFFVTIICTFFLDRKNMALILAIVLLSLEFTGYGIPFYKMKHAAMDYIPVFPWISVSLIGIYLTKFEFHKIDIPFAKYLKPLLFLGKHAFIIYIVHQPIMFGALFLIHKIN